MINPFSSLVLCTGCFDLLHRGHIELFLRAAKFGHLLVGLNSDKAIRRLKGPGRPINNERDRQFMVEAIRCVGWAFIIDSDTVEDAIYQVRPSVWCKGGDWKLETLNKTEVAAANEVGARIEIIPMVEGYSSTATIERMKV